jgi:hypothetical protein
MQSLELINIQRLQANQLVTEYQCDFFCSVDTRMSAMAAFEKSKRYDVHHRSKACD